MKKRPEIDEEELEEYERKVSESASKGFEKFKHSKEVLETFQASVELAEKTHRPVLEALSIGVNAVPPLKLAVNGLVGMWEIARELLFNKEGTKLSKGTKIAFALGLIGLGVGVVAAPAVAGILVIASAGLSLTKEVMNFAVAARAHTKIKNDPEALKASRNDLINKGISIALGATSVVGFALLLTPFAPVGLGLIIGSAAAGIAVKVGPPLISKAYQAAKPLFTKMKNFFFPSAKKSELKQTLQESDRDSHDHVSTADLSEKFSDDPTKEIKTGLKMHYAEAAARDKAEADAKAQAVAQQEKPGENKEEEESEGEGRGPSTF